MDKIIPVNISLILLESFIPETKIICNLHGFILKGIAITGLNNNAIWAMFMTILLEPSSAGLSVISCGTLFTIDKYPRIPTEE